MMWKKTRPRLWQHSDGRVIANYSFTGVKLYAIYHTYGHYERDEYYLSAESIRDAKRLSDDHVHDESGKLANAAKAPDTEAGLQPAP